VTAFSDNDFPLADFGHYLYTGIPLFLSCIIVEHDFKNFQYTKTKKRLDPKENVLHCP